MSKARASWVEDNIDGFPDEWDGFCAGRDIESAMPYRISALLGPDGEPLRVPLPRPKLGFDLSRRGG